MNHLRTTVWCLVVLTFCAPAAAQEADPFERVALLVGRLDSDDAARRLAAETELIAIGAKSPERLLARLPRVGPQAPPAIRAAVERVRRATERLLASRAPAGSLVTLGLDGAPLTEALAEIERQTGNTLRDARAEFGGPGGDRPVTLAADNEPFWRVADRLLDAAGLSVYAYGGEEQLTLIDRPEREGDRTGRAAYAGPFRFEPLRVVSSRGLRDQNDSSLRIEVEVAWEPKLRPIALSHPLERLSVSTDTGERIAPQTPSQSIDLEVTPGVQTLELSLILDRPTREARHIERLSGELTALVPAERHAFRFETPTEGAAAQTESHGDATVTLERFVKQNAIWELHMRLRLEGAGDALASHRGWVFRNTTYLVNEQGDRFEHAGFETTLQTESEVGLAYLFDLPEGDPADTQGLTWVYETPTGVFTVPVSYEFGPLDLP